MSWVQARQPALHDALPRRPRRDGAAAAPRRPCARRRPAPFAAVLGAPGPFPNRRRARVLWLGLDGGAEQLVELARALDEALRSAASARPTGRSRRTSRSGRVRDPHGDAGGPAASAAAASGSAGQSTVRSAWRWSQSTVEPRRGSVDRPVGLSVLLRGSLSGPGPQRSGPAAGEWQRSIRHVSPRRRPLEGDEMIRPRQHRVGQGEEQGARARPPADREAVRQGRDHEARRGPARVPVDAIPTGSIGLDLALGVGGVPRGRVVEIYGPESSGKTTLALTIIAEAQKTGRQRGLHRRRARARRRLRPEARRRHRQPARLPARHRRGGARDRRPPGALRARSTWS